MPLSAPLKVRAPRFLLSYSALVQGSGNPSFLALLRVLPRYPALVLPQQVFFPLPWGLIYPSLKMRPLNCQPGDFCQAKALCSWFSWEILSIPPSNHIQAKFLQVESHPVGLNGLFRCRNCICIHYMYQYQLQSTSAEVPHLPEACEVSFVNTISSLWDMRLFPQQLAF